MGFADMCCLAFAERNVVTETFVGWIYTCKELCLFIDRNRVYWGSKLSFSAYQCMRPSSNLSGLGHRLVYYLLTLPLPLTILGNLQLGPGTELKARLGAWSLLFSPCLACWGTTVSFLNLHGISAVWTVPLQLQRIEGVDGKGNPLQLERIEGVHGKWNKIVVRSG